MRLTLTQFSKMRSERQKIAALTCYDASFAQLAEQQGVELLLVGDSLGMVIKGEPTTLGTDISEMVYHTRAVARGSKTAFIVSDLPFGSYQCSPAQAFDNSAKLLAAGAQMVKLEGGMPMLETISFLSERGIPVCAHIGLTPQSVHALGGYKVQGKTESAAARLKEEALRLQQAGAALIVLEAIPAALAGEITASLSIPTIGIGAGADCSGQVLVLYDMLGIYPGNTPKFAKNFVDGGFGIREALRRYVDEVKAGTFPAREHCF